MSDLSSNIKDIIDYKYFNLIVIVVIAICLIMFFSSDNNNNQTQTNSQIKHTSLTTSAINEQNKIVMSRDENSVLLQNIHNILSLGSTSKDLNRDFEQNNGQYSAYTKNYIDTNKSNLCKTINDHKNIILNNKNKIVNLLNRELNECDITLQRINC